jgi:hypothetical protein
MPSERVEPHAVFLIDRIRLSWRCMVPFDRARASGHCIGDLSLANVAHASRGRLENAKPTATRATRR